MKKLKVHRPAECTCANCCQSEADLRAARLARKRRLVGPQYRYGPWVAYRQRRKQRERGPSLWPRRSKVRPASRVRRVIAKPQWPKWLAMRRQIEAGLEKARAARNAGM